MISARSSADTRVGTDADMLVAPLVIPSLIIEPAALERRLGNPRAVKCRAHTDRKFQCCYRPRSQVPGVENHEVAAHLRNTRDGYEEPPISLRGVRFTWHELPLLHT